jgi:tRNA threonylcarbamoyladenosine biosynthesis protein TsaB
VIVLALDSTTPAGSAALHRDGEDVDVRRGDPDRGWSERLPADLLELLSAHRLPVGGVDLFAVAAGPGSLTGLRVGIATIQGLAFASGRPVVAVSALDALAEAGFVLATALPDAPDRWPAGGAPLLGAWANAMRREVFTALYEIRERAASDEDPWMAIEPPSVSAPDVAAARWRSIVGDRRLIVVGDLEPPLGDALRTAFGPRLQPHQRPPLAGVIARLAIRRAARGEAGPPHAVRPLYVRKPDAVLARERARAPRGEPSDTAV